MFPLTIVLGSEIIQSDRKIENFKHNNQRKQNCTIHEIFTECSILFDQEKYFLRACPFTGKVSGFPSKFCRRKELGPNFSAITNGPNHRF
jgi:hypothetical protein